MRITKVETISLRVPLERPIQMSIGTVSKVDHVLVIIETDIGIRGYGETASEYGPIFSEEFQDSIKACIDNYLAPSILGKDPLRIEFIAEKMNQAARGNWFAKSAVDMALYDIVGKKLSIPVFELLGGLYRKKLPLSYGAYSMNIEEEIESCLDHVRSGTTLIKVKAGVLAPDQDIMRVNKIREAVGHECRIGIDVNQGWTQDMAIKIIKAMEHSDIQFVEQPLPKWDLHGMACVAMAVDTPIMVDESLFSPEDAINCIRTNAAEIFSIKISKSGGLLRAKKIAAIAQAAGIPCFLGAWPKWGLVRLRDSISRHQRQSLPMAVRLSLTAQRISCGRISR